MPNSLFVLMSLKTITRISDVDAAKNMNNICLQKTKTLLTECWILSLSPRLWENFVKPNPSGGFFFFPFLFAEHGSSRSSISTPTQLEHVACAWRHRLQIIIVHQCGRSRCYCWSDCSGRGVTQSAAEKIILKMESNHDLKIKIWLVHLENRDTPRNWQTTTVASAWMYSALYVWQTFRNPKMSLSN